MTGALQVTTCLACGAAFFPARLICPGCGAARWAQVDAGVGVVEETTTVERAVGEVGQPPRTLATVRLPDGLRVIAGLTGPVPSGARVRLSMVDGAVYAQALPG